MAAAPQYPQPMDCAQVHAALRGGVNPEDPAIGAHAQTCAPCAELLAADAELAASLVAAEAEPVDVGALRTATAGMLAADGGPRAKLRRLPTTARLAVLLLVIVVLSLLTLVATPRPDLSVYPVTRMALVLAALAAMATGASIYVVRPLHLAELPRGLHGSAVLSAVALPLLLSVLPVAHSDHPMAYRPEPFAPATLACFAFGTVVAAVVLGGLWAVERRNRLPRRVLVLGVALAGLAGNLALQLHCPVTDPAHLVVGHGLIGALWVAVFGVAPR